MIRMATYGCASQTIPTLTPAVWSQSIALSWPKRWAGRCGRGRTYTTATALAQTTGRKIYNWYLRVITEGACGVRTATRSSLSAEIAAKRMAQMVMPL